MNLTELKAAIAVELKRTDMTAIIAQTIKSVVLAEHATFDFVRDAAGAFVDMGAPETVTQFDYHLGLTRARKTVAVFLSDVNQGQGVELEKKAASQLLEDGIFIRQNFWYLAGDQLVIKTSEAQQYFYVRYFQYPDVADATFTSWIVRDVPYYVVHKCAAVIMAKNLGKADEAKGQLGLAQLHAAAVLEQMEG
jgi:hypothetical protein